MQFTGNVAAYLSLLLLVSCTESVPTSEYDFVEWIEVKGACQEDHVKQPANYQGDLVHWRNRGSGISNRYGSVHNAESMIPEATIASIADPHSYRPPFIVSFDDVAEKDFGAATFTIHGISEHITSAPDSAGPKYKATCELAVTRRMNRLPTDAERKAWSS